MPVARFIRASQAAPVAPVAPVVDVPLLEAAKLALRIDDDAFEEARSQLTRNIAAAQALAERQAPDAPDAVKTEAIIRAVAYFFEGAVPDGSQPAAIWRISGAAALLSPWQVRRGGIIA